MAAPKVIAGKLSLSTARNRLASLWFILTALVVTILLGQVLIGQVYAGDTAQVLEWLGGVLWPTTMLMAGVLGADAVTHSAKHKEVSRGIYRLTFGVCAFYLLVALFSVLAGGYVTSRTPLELLESTRPFLLAGQGAITALLAGFFGVATVKAAQPADAVIPAASGAR